MKNFIQNWHTTNKSLIRDFKKSDTLLGRSLCGTLFTMWNAMHITALSPIIAYLGVAYITGKEIYNIHQMNNKTEFEGVIYNIPHITTQGDTLILDSAYIQRSMGGDISLKTTALEKEYDLCNFSGFTTKAIYSMTENGKTQLCKSDKYLAKRIDANYLFLFKTINKQSGSEKALPFTENAKMYYKDR